MSVGLPRCVGRDAHAPYLANLRILFARAGEDTVAPLLMLLRAGGDSGARGRLDMHKKGTTLVTYGIN